MTERTRPFDRTTRRRVVAALAGATIGAGLGLGRVAAQAQPTPSVSGDCTTEPGVQLLLDWRSGKVLIAPDDLVAPLGWKLVSSTANTLALLIPPDWQMEVAWADGFSQTGAPHWVTTLPALPQLSVTRVISADSSAAFEYALGTIEGIALTPQQTPAIAQQGLLGESPTVSPICSIYPNNPLTPAWMAAVRYDKSVLMTTGLTSGMASAILPSSVITYTNMYGPQASFAELMRTVFVRFYYQMSSSGGGDTPTPTPTEEDS